MGWCTKHAVYLIHVLIIIQAAESDPFTSESTASTTTSKVTTPTEISTTNLPSPVIGENCTNGSSCIGNNSECKENKCQCQNGYFNLDNTTCLPEVGLGSNCSQTDACKDTNAECNGTCVCKSGYYDDDGVNVTDGNCTAKVGLGSNCSQTDACKDTNAECNGTCVCQPGYYDDNGFNVTDGNCTAKVGLGSDCPQPEACFTPHAECGISPGNKSGICVCREGFYDTNGTEPRGQCFNVTDLKVTAINYTMITEKSISITWTESINHDAVNYYIVEHKSSGNNNTSQTVGKNTYATLSGLVPGQRYSIKIKSVNNNTALSERSTYEEYYQISKPNIPGNLTENENISATSGNINLTWRNPEGVETGYIGFLENTTLLFKYNQSFSTSGTMLSQTFYGVKNGTWYNFTVQSISGYNDTDTLYSEVHREPIKTSVQVPDPPDDIRCSDRTDTYIKLMWNAPVNPNGDLRHFIINVNRTGPGPAFAFNVTTATATTTYDVVNLTEGSFYTFQIYTVNEQFQSASASEEQYCETRANMSEAPTNLSISNITSRSFTTSWSKPTNVRGELIGYILIISYAERNKDCVVEEFINCSTGCKSAFPNQTVISPTCKENIGYQNIDKTELLSRRNFTSTFNPDTVYMVSVAAVNQGGKGHTNSTTATTMEEAPQKPYNVSYGNIYMETTKATIRWNIDGPPPGKTNYTIIVTGDSPAENKTYTISGFLNTSCNITDLQEYWNYTLTVTASTIKGSNRSDPVTFKTNVAASGIVSKLSVGEGSGGDHYATATVSWGLPGILERNGPIKGFIIQQEEIVNGTFSEISNRNVTSVNDESHKYSTDFKVEREQLYRFKVFAYNGFDGDVSSINFSASPATGNMSRPVVRSDIHRLTSDGNQLVFYCDFDPLSDISALYQVTWYRDRLESGSKLMSFAYIQYNSRDNFRSLTYLSEVHITLGMTIFCSISATKLNVTAPSEPYFAGFEITSNNSLKLQYTEETLVYIRLTVPFGCRRQSEECFLGVNMFYMETGADNCLVPVAAALSNCGARISSWKWNQSYAIRLALKDGQNLHSISRTYNIRFKTDEQFDHVFFSNYTLPRDIQVEATSDTSGLNGKECHAICDPHMQTFDGRYYENQNKGTYILYKHLKIPVQVQMRTNPCYGFQEGPPFCPCGVAIAAGRDVFVVDRCSIPIMIYMPQCDEGNLQGKIKSDGNIYQIYLPSGSWVTITSGISFNIYIYPSISDRMTTSGLCGYLDSEIQNDFMLRNGTTVPDDKFEDFNSNWLVKPEEDLFNTSNYLSLPKWPREDYFCICEEYQHGRGFQADNCSPDSRKFCPESTLNDSMAADCSRKLSTNANMTVQLDPSDFNVSESKNDTTMTKRNFTEDSANYECWSYLNSSLLFKKCSEVPDIVPESFVNTCTKDALIARTMFWAATHLDNAQKKCIYQVTVNQPLSEQIIKKYNVTLNPDGQASNKTTNESGIYTSALLQELKDMACPMNCTNQGICVKGQCLCCNGYGGTDCSVDLSKAPDVYGIPNRGVCDLHEMSCDHASVLGYNFADSPNLSCRLSLFQVKGNDRRSHDNSFIILKAKWISFAEISCPIVDVRSKRSVEFPDDLDSLAIGYSVAVGNNREIFGRNISLLIIDSLCVDCIKAGFDITCKLKEGFDLINRRCIKKKSAEEETKSGSTVLIISTVVGSVLAVIVIGVTLHYCLIFRRKRAKYEKETRETAYAEMQEMDGQKETYSNIEVYDEIKDLPDDYLTPQDTSPTDDESEDGEGSYEKLSDAEKNVSEGYVYLNTLTTDECESKARKQRTSTGESNMHFQ